MTHPAPPVTRFYVATYGDGGLEVVFFTDPRDYTEAVALAKGLHEQGRLDSYTHGDVP
jgi:hypothetical protein